MARQAIGIGAAPNDGTGDTLRDAMDKVNDNFIETYNVAVEPVYFYFSGRNFRIGERGAKMCIDQTITALGFDVGGVENVNWGNVFEFALP
jgi:hypothetical protein